MKCIVELTEGNAGVRISWVISFSLLPSLDVTHLCHVPSDTPDA